MRDAHLAGSVNKGAGIYGVPAPTHVTTCPNSNNAFGHSAACPCRTTRKSQVVPYAEEDHFGRSPHEQWWPGDAA